MSLGKASIKRASAAGRKKVVENAAVITASETEEIRAKFLSEDVVDEKNNRPVRLKDEMPTYLL